MSKITSFQIEVDLLKGVNRHRKGTQSISQFAHEATIEKVNRMDARDERARMQILEKNKQMLKPIIMELLDEMK